MTVSGRRTAAPSVADPALCSDLHGAAFLDDPEEAAALLAAGADLECRDELDNTPLVTAAMGGGESVVALLLDRGADPAAVDEMGWTALDHAKAKLADLETMHAPSTAARYRAVVALLERAGDAAAG